MRQLMILMVCALQRLQAQLDQAEDASCRALAASLVSKAILKAVLQDPHAVVHQVLLSCFPPKPLCRPDAHAIAVYLPLAVFPPLYRNWRSNQVFSLAIVGGVSNPIVVSCIFSIDK